MTAFLASLLGRLPIGWLQLVHNKNRLAAALAGVAFSNILIFMQLGFLGALTTSTKLPYLAMKGDILLSSPSANTLADPQAIPRQRMYQAKAVSGVRDATPVYVGILKWEREDGGASNLRVFGIDPDKTAFHVLDDAVARNRLKLSDEALIADNVRGAPREIMEAISPDNPLQFEASRRTLSIQRTFDLGSGFDSDGFLIVSDQTFLSLFPKRVAGAPNIILITLDETANIKTVQRQLRKVLSSTDTRVETLKRAADRDSSYQLNERPVGVVFGFGVIIGVLVGIVIVYQVLSTDVADHLAEYATFKAIGYKQRFFLGIVFEEAIILAVMGFIPGMAIVLVLYQAAAAATQLPIEMTTMRAIAVFLGTIAMCTASGAIATRRLAGADPADLF